MPNTRALHRKPQARHVAIIMDGNGRWAQRRGLPRLSGHAKGVERLREVLRAAPDLGLTHVTLYAFSTENWKRSEAEVAGLMRLFRRYIRKESARLVDAGARIRFIGNRHRLDQDLQGLMAWLEELTAPNTKLNVTVAIDYGGRDEILRATRRALCAIQAGELAEDELSDAVLSRYMDTADLPDPDLVLRTSGEVRVSNFLLWQAAYAEYEFLDICWPDFTGEVLAECLERYGTRERRFGAVVG
ncbi:MAG: polyprenyl diphosphate synthase [Pseudomonadota bacterium]